MKKIFLSLACVIAIGASTATLNGDIINLTPSDIHLDDTSTAQFSDGALTLTPFIGTTQDTFNGNAARLGIDNNGTNNNAFNDVDTDPNNGNEERLVFDFVANAGLTRISYDFSRADGTTDNDGVIISGFLQDPNVTFSLSDANLFAVYLGAGTVRINIPGQLFNGNDIDINFDAAASDGQTLSMSVTDTDQAGAQLAIVGIAYNNQITAVPEPATASILGIIGVAAFARRRRS